MGRRRIMGSICAALILTMIVAFAYLPIRIMQNASTDGNRVARSHEVRKELRDVAEALRSVVYHHRNFIFTNENLFRNRRDREMERLLLEIEEVHILVGDNPLQTKRVEELKASVKDSFMVPLLEEKPAPPILMKDPRALTIYDRDRLTEPFFTQLDLLDRNEVALLELRKARLEKTVRNDSLVSIFMGVASCLLLLGLYSLHRYDAREKELHAEVLKRANIEVEKANRMKSEFLAKMSHEIRTPLAAIIGFADLLSAPDIKEEERARNVDVIRRNSRALGQIIDDILDLSKVEAGKISIEHIEFDLSELLSDIFLLFNRKAKEKGLHFSVDSSTSLPMTLISDPTRIRQILINMVSNAIKFTHSGSVKILVSWDAKDRAEGDKTGTLTFAIFDTGVGINDAQKEKLFQPFSQAEDSTARQFGGTGLGLVLSRQLAQLLGGTVDLATSAPGRGSTFIVTLEAINPTETVQSVPHLHLSENLSDMEPEEFNATLIGVRILLAEDAPDNQLLITQILETCGAEVTVVDNGRKAVDEAVRGHYHLILMDVQMPVLGGHEASRELRGLGYEGPIVALTAHAMVEERQRSNNVGYDDYLTKPVDSQKLIQTIQKHTLERAQFKAEKSLPPSYTRS